MMAIALTAFIFALGVVGVFGMHPRGGSHLILFPQKIIRGTPYEIAVSILNTTEDVQIETQLQNDYYNSSTRRWETMILHTQSGTFSKGNSGVMSMTITDTFDCTNCNVHVRGRGALQFESKEPVSLHRKLVSLLVQMDKAIYKPDQIARYRALAVYPDLQIYPGTFNVVIKDPNSNTIYIEKEVKSERGVIEGSFQIGSQPPFGRWTVDISLEETNDMATKTFTVEDYQLPRFEVKVELAPYILLTEPELTGKVHAKYTFDQQVTGRVELRVGPETGVDQCGNLPPAVETTFEIDGTADFRIPLSDIQRVTRVRAYSTIRVTAFVKEATTGVRLNGSNSITFYSNQYSIKFLDSTPGVFKPGLPYTAFIQVNSPDNMPPPQSPHSQVGVYAYATYSVKHPDMKYYGLHDFTGTYPLPGYNASLPDNGVLSIDIDVPDNATSITITVHYSERLSTSKTVTKSQSKSNNYIQLALEGRNLKPNDKASVNIQTTESVKSVNYMILSRGSILRDGKVLGDGVNLKLDLDITAEMAPTAHLIAYYTRESDEIVADSIAFNIDGIFSNEVSIEFSSEKSQPREEVDVIVTADPGSNVHLLAVDQSVLLLKSGNDITSDRVENAIAEYDDSAKPSDSEFALSYSSRDTEGVFRQSGLSVITDISIRRQPTPHYSHFDMDMDMHGLGMPGPPSVTLVEHARSTGFDTPPPNERTELQKIEKVRKIFPEAWLWESSVIGDDGRAVISTTVPDTITSWIASAFATSLRSGLGVAPSTAKMTVFRPFFVSLTYPSSVKVKEIAIVQATVFNYLGQHADVVVTLTATHLFAAVPSDSDSGDPYVKRIRVPADEQITVYFPILTKDVGLAEVEIKAHSRLAADGVSRMLSIEPEGAPVNFNYPMYINVPNDGKRVYEKDMEFPLPPHAVRGSENVKVKVTGDLIGPSLENIDSLLSLPTGCGEQSMVRFAPNVYVARYLKATGQMSNALEKKIFDLLRNGYQRQVTYQRNDGSFSAFGNLDESGSTWLTAFVGQTLNAAREFIYVDPNMLVRILDWILDRQNADGSFNEFGRVLDPNTQGADTGHALTAYVLTSLIKTRDLIPLSACDENRPQCHKAQVLINVTLNAMKYLETQLDFMTTPFTLALTSYALSLAKSSRAENAFDKLLALATNEGPLAYWQDKAIVPDDHEDKPMPPKLRFGSKFSTWRPPRVQSRPIDIMVTSYAILTYASHDRLEDCIDALRWLTKQRNSMGGFVSTQDTNVALQALSVVAAQTIKPHNRVRVMVKGDKRKLRFRINEKNALQLQVQEFRRVPRKIEVRADGKGFALAEVECSFNINKELSTPSFDVSPVMLDDDIDSFNLMICTKWLWDRKTGMVVQEIGIPSGFSPDLTTLGNVVGMKRSERRGNVVAIYFDEIGKTSTCYSLLMTRTGKVAQSRQSFIKTYDYYQPGDQSTVFYHPRKLRESTVSDVCPQC